MQKVNLKLILDYLLTNNIIKEEIMFKFLKQLTSLVAVVAVVFVFTTESMAAKKIKNT